ncbi:hypothetical protein, partial [Chitinophaga sp.]|uniref:hypothetical protein n=1 Tax=Chitinophaga sp. TaxID=1869181 RepID=UPI002FDCD6DF
FNHSNGNPSNGLLWGYNTDYWKIFVESPQDTPAGNMIFEANDNGDEGWIFRSKTPGAAYDILALKRDFSSFRGFLAQRPFSLNPENNTVNQFWNAMGGAMVTPDPEFRLGNNGLSVYNNAQGSSAVTVERTNTPLTAAVPNASGYYLKVTSAPGAAPQTTLPGLGGVALRYTSAENKVYVTRIKALIPEGYTLKPAANVFGTNSMSYWLTSDKGTGKWEDYIHVYAAGYTGTFNDICYYYLDGPMQTTTWYVGYFDFKIPTAAPWADQIRHNHGTGRPYELYLEDNSTKLSKGDFSSLRITTPGGYLDIGPQSGFHSQFGTDRESFRFLKPTLFDGKLGIYNGAPSTGATTYLAQTEGRINGSPILTEAGGGGNFLRKLADTAQAGPLWMKGAIKTDGALITKIAHGYAGIQLRNVADVIRFGFGLSTGENGANAGSDFHIWRFKDTGDSSNVAMRISRVNGDVWFPGIVSSSSGSKITGDGNGSSFYSYLGFYDNNNQRYGYVGKGRRGSTEMQIHSDSGNVTIVPKGGNQLVVSSNYMTYYGGAFYLDNPATNTLHFSQGTN